MYFVYFVVKKMKRPLFSCVIPVKGARPYFDEALDSLQNQGLGDDLEIIVQDGDVEPDKGQSDALNKGFAKARGEWLFWLNADDVLLPGVLKSLALEVKSKEFKDVEWIAGGTKYIDDSGSVIGRKFDKRWHPWLYRHLPVWTFGPSSFFKKELWDKHGEFDIKMHYMMDLELWTRWARLGKRFGVFPDFAWGFRVHAGSKTTGGRFDDERSVERKTFYRRYGIRFKGFWLNLHRLSRIIDGSYFKR